MIFKQHSELKGLHAYLSPSSHAWLGYTKAKLATVRKHHWAKIKGTVLHSLAEECIKSNVQLKPDGSTLSMYVNDCIEYNVKALESWISKDNKVQFKTEQPLFYSKHCFGTADAICFDNGRLLIFDLKTGEKKASMEQLKIYAALFCLEYHFDPRQLIDIELRIYQSGDIVVCCPTNEEILNIMDIIVVSDETINEVDREDGEHGQ